MKYLKVIIISILLIAMIILLSNITHTKVYADGNVVVLDENEIMSYLYFNDSNDTIISFDDTAFKATYPGKVPSIIIPTYGKDGTTPIKTIGKEAFAARALDGVIFLPDSQLETIGVSSFYNNNIKVLNLPKSIITIEDNAFAENQIEKLDLSENTNLTVLKSNVFYDSILTELKLPEGLTRIGNSCFGGKGYQGDSRNTTIIIPSTVEYIGDSAFGGFSNDNIIKLPYHEPGYFKNIFWSFPGSRFMSQHTIIWSDINKDTTTDTCFVFNTETGMIIGLKPDADTGGYSDWNNGNIIIPNKIGENTVNGLAEGAFFHNNNISGTYTKKIKSISFAEPLSITEIPNGCFAETRIKIVIPEGITKMGNYVFGGNIGVGIKEITLPKSLETITPYTFMYIAKLEKITFLGNKINTSLGNVFPDSVKEINLKEYNYGTLPGAPWGAKYATINWKDKTEYPDIKYSDDGLWEVNIEKQAIVGYLGNKDMQNEYWNGNTFVLPSTIKVGGTDVNIIQVGTVSHICYDEDFRLAEKIVKISNGIEILGGSSFDASNVLDLQLPISLKRISGSATANNPKLTSVNLQSLINLEEIDSSNFTSLVGEVIIPGNVKEINVLAFNSPDITAFRVRQYRNQEDDGIYDEANGKFHKAPLGVIRNLPAAARHVGTNVFYADDPQPQGSITSEILLDENCIKLKLNVKTNNSSYIIKEIKENGNAPQIDPGSVVISDNNSTATMTIKNKSTGTTSGGNGIYEFTIKWGLRANNNLDSWYNVNIEIKDFYNIIYSPNGGNGNIIDANSPYVKGYLRAQTAINTFNKDGHSFVKWNTESDGSGVSYREEDTLPAITENITLYAIYKAGTPAPTPITYSKITYDLNGGMLDGKTGIVVLSSQNGTTIILPKPTREGYVFDYWEGSRYEAGDSYEVDGDHVFTAQWKKETNSTDSTNNEENNISNNSNTKTPKTGDNIIIYTLLFIISSIFLVIKKHINKAKRGMIIYNTIKDKKGRGS